MTERRVVEERGPRGGLDPAVGVFIAIVAAALIGLLIWYFAGRDDNGSDSNNPAPAPTSTSQQQDQPQDQPSDEDSSEPAPSTSP